MSQEPSTPTSIEELPDEIIDRIFALSHQENYDPHQVKTRGTVDSHAFPWNVASVSKTWRSIVLSRPGFWSIIDLDLDECCDTHSRLIVQVEPIVRLMLERSTPAPLIISFKDYWKLASSGLAEDIMVLLVQHSKRWAELLLGISFELFDVLDGVRNRLPILSKLVLQPYGTETLDDWEFAAFERAPRLESLTLKDVDNVNPYRFPTQQIKVLKVLPVYLGYNLIEQCPLLEDCEIEYSLSHVPKNDHGSILPLERPNLHRLATNSVSLTQRFHFPALKTLVLVSHITRRRQSIHDINHFIASNHCSLNNLLISCRFEWDLDSGDPDPVHRLFELVPQLTYLGITEEEDSQFTPWDTLARHLVGTDGDSAEPLVPHLNEIAFVAKAIVPMSGEIREKLEEMIAFRTSYREGRFRAELRGFEVPRYQIFL